MVLQNAQHEKYQAKRTEHQASNPKPLSPRQGSNCAEGDGNLE
jgi:hypothetical protein